MKIFSATLLILIIIIQTGFAQQPVNSDLQQLVEAERAFARLSVEKGSREAFLAWFADDGINFQPHPVKTREALSKTPPQTNSRNILNWAPIFGDISAAGDIGYSTGPYTVTENKDGGRRLAQGMFFSVWRKQADGQWRVIVDLGIQTPSLFCPLDTAYRRADQNGFENNAAQSITDQNNAKLLRIENQFFELAGAGKSEVAWKKYLMNNARIYRQENMPIMTPENLAAWVNGQEGKLSGKTIRMETSRSGDLGYSYGSYEYSSEKGYYVRIWRKNEKGEWRIAFDVTNPLP